eukprot:CAMPEP_0170481288 /NCGR_PEP_ID=MMETSP0208-20121228/1784_1 /TAXON_ID=197538 /ORGANISM="Strombidium inclinatum, Strain S3" /LENGTH=89 /DNA_ID=CAMNT_0010753961 /DNA_START=28 /DNA_END=297 /DNA_ORIENTATION=-
MGGTTTSTTTNVKQGITMQNQHGKNVLTDNYYHAPITVSGGAKTSIGYNFLLLNLDQQPQQPLMGGPCTVYFKDMSQQQQMHCFGKVLG